MKKPFSIGRVNITPRQVLFVLLFLESLFIAIAITKAVVRNLSPAHYFGENRLITDVSCVQLAIASMLALAIFWIVRHSHNSKLAQTSSFWLIVSLGLLFLAFDDAYEIHERLDLWLHRLLQIQQTDLTDLADDAIVGGYLLVFLGYVAKEWHTIEIFKQSFAFFQLGFMLTVIMVILDMASNNNYFISLMIDDPIRVKALEQWLGVLEDSAKIFAEGMFIVGIYQCWQTAMLLSHIARGDRATVNSN